MLARLTLAFDQLRPTKITLQFLVSSAPQSSNMGVAVFGKMGTFMLQVTRVRIYPIFSLVHDGRNRPSFHFWASADNLQDV